MWTAIVLALVLQGCSSGSGDSEARRSVDDVVEAWATSRDGSERCGLAATDRLVRRIHGDAQRCRRAESAVAGRSGLAPKVRQRVERRGALATARIRLMGGRFDGAAGALELVEDDGTWRVDKLGTDFLRALFSRSVFGELRVIAKGPRLRVAPARACVATKINGLGETRFRASAHAALGQRAAGYRPFARIILSCLNTAGTGADGRISALDSSRTSSSCTGCNRRV